MSRKLASNYRSSVASGVSTGSTGTGIGDVTGDLLDITYQEEVRRRPYEGPKPIVCEPPYSLKRELGAIPFHIPHKKLLEKIEYKRVMPEPLTGFQQFQELTMQSRKRTLSEDTLVVPKSVKKAQRPGITFKEYISRRHTTKLEYVMDQTEWIEKFRQTTDGSFVYMTYAVPNSHELFYPYALSIVPYKQVDKSNFFTMSAKGVMQHVGSEIIFTTLDKWEKEYKMYCRLMEIRLFHYFRKWKGFYVWRINVKRKKIYNAKRNLEENMLSLNPILRQGLLDIQDMCFKMIDVTFTDVSDIENTWLFYFIEDQMDKFHQIMKKIEEYHEVAREVVGNACHAALLAKGFVVDERIIDESIKDKRKRIHKASYIEQAAKKKFCERLASFIILVDYITINMLHQLITNSTHDLLCALEKHTQFLPTQQQLDKFEPLNIDLPRTEDAPKLPFFVVYAKIVPEEILLDPSLNITLDMFNQIMSLWQEKTIIIKSFVGDPYYSVFTTPIINEKVEDRICGWGPTLEFYLKKDEYLTKNQEELRNYFKRNYEAAFQYLRRYDPIRQFYAEDILVEKEDIENERDLETFRNLCTRYYREIATIESIKPSQEMGVLFIQLEGFNETCLPVSTQLLGYLERTIPWIGKTKVDEMIEEANEIEAFLAKEPVLTADYVKYLDYIEESNQRIDKMEETLDYCKELYDIIEEFHIDVAIEEINAYYNLSVALGTLRNVVDRKMEDSARLIKLFSDNLNKDISALISQVGNIKDECMQPWLYDINSKFAEVMDFLSELFDKLIDAQKRANEFKEYQKQFRLEVTRFDILDEVMNDVKLRILLWESVDSWAKTVDEWYHAVFDTLNVDDMNAFIAKNMKYIAQLEKGLPPNLIVPKFRDEVELMKDKLPVVCYLRNPAMKNRHWLKVENQLNHKFKPDEVMTLALLENLGVFNYPTELMEISGQASSEAGLEALLKKVEEAWKTLEFPIIQHKDSKDVYIFGSLEEVQAALDESNINMATIVSSKHVGPIKPRVDEWSKNLDLFSRTLDEWMMCQQSWVYLEVIFSAPDIQRQLPNEAKLFTIVDKSWKEIMRRTAKMPLAMESGLYPGTLEAFQRNNALLEQIMKCLESYLETKRVAFPRFYFLSNDELLDILAQTRNPHAVQPHLRKCFDAIAKLEFGVKIPDEIEENADKKKDEPVEVVLTTDIIAMISPEGERVVLGKGLKARGNVEDWLGKVEESMVLSLKRLMKASLVHYHNHPRTEWVLAHANQIILTVSQIMWAKGVHDIFDAPASVNKIKKMEQYETKCIHDLNNLAVLVRQDLPSVTRKILVALITIDVHARDTISNIVSSKITNSMSFEWLKVLRYYWDEVIDDCVARMSSAYYIYGYEYLGAAGVLVITPLTDKCYLCLMGALQLDLGGAPAGPAGTGKTETTKDLAKALAIQCVVFNCSEGLDYKMMGRFFSGLAQSGAWCCFDEFNRIDIEVLSVIAQQLITIRNAKAAKAQRFMFEGREIKLVQKCAAFITMNPGYAGRTELPDNLKALFRPISMMVPDYALIAEVILYSEGFESSKNLSQKMVQMYKLCSEQLSQQDHYDFGMRAVKSVLVMAGSLKRSAPDREENVVLICALRDSNLPKFLSDDAILFTGILGDLFPGVDLPVPDYGVFQNTIIEVMVEHNLQPEHCMIHKVIQLYETMIVRWGVMLVGPTGGGKTEILNTLNRTLTKMHEYGIPGQQFRPVRTYKMNPKAVTAGELYGEVNQFTLEWKDGLMGIMMRTAVGFTTEEHQWIICDGPVDAVWIENLNTVLDDNKMLCLANSERIKLTQWVHMVFEVQDLAQASPATVSRCGMVYVDSEEIKWFPYVKSWINRISENLLTQEMKEYILQLFDYAVEKGFRFVKKHCHYSIHQVDVSKAKMICSLIESCIKMPGAMDKIGEKSKVRCFLCQTFIFAYLWGIGGNLMDESREKFEIRIREQFDEHPDSKLQAGHDLWDVYMDVVAHKLELWSRIIPSFQYNPEISYFETLVPTMDTVRFGYIMERLINVDNPVFITGDTGVGKSVVAKDCLQRLFLTKKFVPATMNFSAQTSSFRTQEIIELKLEKKKKTLLGAPVGKKVVIFVDDVNMPKLETYGAQPPVELLRQFLDFGGLYDREKLFWKEIRDVIITVACAPPGGGRNPLTPRFVRHFGMLLIPPPSEGALKLIFKSILKGFFTPFTNEVRALAEYMVNAAVDIYQRIESDLLPTPAKSHYVFNLRDLSKCIQGVTQADPGSMRTEVATLRLFYHECLRVFHDRLINIEDKSYFYLLMRDICNRNFGSPVLDLPEGNVIENPPVLLFGDFMQMGAEKANRVYEELRNIDKVKNVLQDYLDDFNLSTAKEMKLIFFMMAIEHCLRIARVLRSERGNALLVGVGGMGKQSLTKLASHLNAYKCFQIELTRNYDHAAFFDDLRKMCFHAGVEFQDSVFLFTDTQIVQEEFLEDINNLLNSGEVPNLYEADEYEKVIIGVRPAAKEAGIDEANRDGIYNYFISRLRDKLHLVICMSPVGDAFRRRCRMFPSLVNCCTIDWFEKWPQEALLSVAENEMRSLGEDLCLHLANVCVYMHESVENMTVRFYNEMKRYYYTTPSSYLELIKLYKSMLGIKKDKIGKTRDKIANGLKKLYETNEVIDSMKETLTALEPVLAQKSVAVEELMVYLGKEQTQADKVRVVVKADEEVAKVKAEETQAIADDAQKDLDTALPALEAATKALESLNKNDINEVKVFQKPPKLVQVVMESVCILLGAKPDWASAKVVLGDANFLKKLQEYDKDHVSDLTMKKLKAYVDNPDFIPEKVQKVSKACKSLCLWVRAIDMYAKVYRIVEPKRKKLQQAEKELGQVMGLLRDKQMKLAEVEGQIADLEAKFNETVAEKQALEDNMELTATRLNRAGRLNVALGDEQVRWEESVEKFGIELDNAVGDVVMAAACVAYLGAFTSNYRIELVLSWEKKCQAETIPASEIFRISSSMTCIDQNKKTWVGSSIQEICNNKDIWSFNITPINISQYHAVLFKLPVTLKEPPEPFKCSEQKHWDDDHVRMPYSDKNLFPVCDNGVEAIKLRWKLIKNTFQNVQINNSYELEAAIHTYNSSMPSFTALHQYFEDMEEEETNHFYEGLLPKIISLALNLPQILPGNIPLLKQHHNRSVSLSQYQVASLLANAFLCTFPWRKSTAVTYPGVNFASLFIADKRPKRQSCIFEKFKCIFNYFRMVTTSPPLGVITFERKHTPKSLMPRWDTLDNNIGHTKIHIDSSGTIEDNGLGFLQVDFANKNIGGGVLRYGCVQEEIRFVICPELIITRLFIEQLTDLEAVVVTGAQRFSNYSGYGDTFVWEGPHNDLTPYDEYGRRRTSISIIDATRYTKSFQQFYPSAMLRELNKAYVGFSTRDKSNLSPVATGNWGCGAFNGSLYLKSLLQLMACSGSGRNLVYYTFGNDQFRDDFYEIYTFLATNNIKIEQLWKILCGFSLSSKSEEQLYPFIQQAYFDSKKQPSVKSFLKTEEAGTSNSLKPKNFYLNNKKINKINDEQLDMMWNTTNTTERLFDEEMIDESDKLEKCKNETRETLPNRIKEKMPKIDIGDLIDEMDGHTTNKNREFANDSLLTQIDKLSKNSRICEPSVIECKETMEIVDVSLNNAKSKRKISDYFSKVTLITVLADPYDIRMWNSCGLPRDSVSTENAILVTQAGRWPLMIDPQEQANRWIRQMEADKNLKVIKLTDSNFMRILESAVTIGLPVLLEEVGETLDPTLGPILLKQTFIQGGRTLIRLGESDVEYSDNFRFYITTKLANPHYLPEICIQVTIVNFTVTLSGLEDQLLADVVRLERPDLEHQRTELIIRINSDKAQLKSIEDKILYLLYHSEGNILDDEELIETLNESKETSAIIEARLIETEATEEKISVAREKYRIVAIRGSVLYFVVADLADIDPMYQYSLKYFNQVFNNVIEVSEKNEILEQRLAILLREITKAVYTIISRGLFERHKLVYSFMLCVAVLQQNGIVSDAQWNFLLRGPVGTKTTLPKKPDYPIITDTIWTAANYLSYTYKHFEGLQNELLKIITVQIGDYQLDIQLISNSKPSQINWNDRLDDFDKLMLIKSLAEEKLIFAITEYVKTKLGKVFIESPQVSLPVLYQDTSNSVPLIFILSTGSDPFGAFQRFAAEMEYGNRIKSISLGQGQGPVAEKLIQDAVETGDWVFLQNCHLATSWMLSMEKIVLTIARDSNKVHKQFRLYMSSMPSKTFPVSVLQNSVKVTNEPPKGLRANIKRSFSEMDKAFFEDHPLEHKWKAMLFGLCTFHAVVQERKKFGPLGWNIIYEFNDSDRDFAFNTLKMFCAEGFIPWDALEYLTGEITYGGRVTDYWDLRCLKTILKIFFSPQILRNDYVYSSSGTYYCPIYKNIEDYRIFVDKLPIIEEPEIFGMHENANIAYQIKETNAVIRTIVDCQPRASGSAEGRSSDDIVYELAEGILNSVIPKIPTDDVNVHMYKRDKKGRISSLTTVLTQEIDRYDKLLRLIHNSMKQLQKAIKGLVVMSDALEEIFTAFMNNQVPGMWSKNAYNSLKSLGSWIRDLILRLDFISIWVRYGPPTSYWISGFYFPQGFLTGTLQTFARKYNLPIDELKYDFHLYNNVLDQEDIYGVHVAQEKEVYTAYKLYEHPIDGVIIHGLFIDAGRWDFKIEELVDAKPGEINPPLPLMWLKPTRKMPLDDPRYVAPLYKTSIRAGVLSTTGHSTNFVIAVLLPTKQKQAYWILKGTALLTQITD